LRLLVGGGVASVLITYLLVLLVAAVAGLTAGAAVAVKPLLVLAIPLWLAAQQVPLVVAGAPLGVLPLLPTGAVLALAALVAGRLTRKLGGRPREDVPAVVASLAGAHASAAVLATALPQNPVQASGWSALLGAGVVAGTGALLGAVRQAGLPGRWRVEPEWLRGGLAAAGIAGLFLVTAASVMVFASLLVAVGDVHGRLQASSSSPGAGVGMTLLSLCYLPNGLVAAVSWLAGPGLSIGSAAASPLFAVPGPVPPVPLMAAMPMVRPPGWSGVVFVLPISAGVLAGLRCRQVGREPAFRLAAAGVATTTVAVGIGLLAALVSGRLAGGPFDPVQLPAGMLAAALLGWVGIPAVAMALSPTLVLRPPTSVPRPHGGRDAASGQRTPRSVTNGFGGSELKRRPSPGPRLNNEPECRAAAQSGDDTEAKNLQADEDDQPR
jgi:Family of unknown function (DUF6350)